MVLSFKEKKEMEELKQKHKLELEKKKHEYTMEELGLKREISLIQAREEAKARSEL